MDGSANRLPTPGLGGRLAPLTQFVRQPAVQRALPTIAMASAIGIAALAYFTMQAAPQAQLFAGLGDADQAAAGEARQPQGIEPNNDSSTGARPARVGQPHPGTGKAAGREKGGR